MSSPPWLKSLQRALTSNTSLAFSKYMQLATVTPQGMPANRTVVFRGLGAPELQHAVIMVSDSRSTKFTDLQHQPHAEIAWYFPLTREQFRIFGRVVVIDQSIEEQSSDQSTAPEQVGGWQTLFATRQEAAAYRLRAWAAQSDTARLTYDQAQPGQARGTVSRSDLDKYNAQPQDIAFASPHFAVLLLLPLNVDHLTLPSTKPDPRRPAHFESVLQPSKTGSRWSHERASIDANAEWRTTELNP